MHQRINKPDSPEYQERYTRYPGGSCFGGAVVGCNRTSKTLYTLSGGIVLASMTINAQPIPGRRIHGRTTEPQPEQWDGYQRLAAAMIAQALQDARQGDWGALVWLLSEDCQSYAEWIGDDYNRIQRAAILISDQLIAAREKVTE